MGTPLTFLYVDDHIEDHVLLREACRLGAKMQMHGATSYEEAVAYLSGTGNFSDRARYPLPDFVMIDYNLEVRSGSELVSWIRSQPRFSRIPAVMYSGMDTAENVEECYAAGADCFFVKPLTFRSIQALMSMLAQAYGSTPATVDLLQTIPAFRPPKVRRERALIRPPLRNRNVPRRGRQEL